MIRREELIASSISLSSLEIDSEKLSEPSQKVYKQVIKEIAKTAKAEKTTAPSDSK